MMERRTFIAAMTGGLLAAPLAAEADEGKIYRIGLLMTPPFQPGSAVYYPMFIAAMRDLGYVEGRNLVIEVRSADNRPERLPALATELVQLNLDVIVTKGDGEVRAAKKHVDSRADSAAVLWHANLQRGQRVL